MKKFTVFLVNNTTEKLQLSRIRKDKPTVRRNGIFFLKELFCARLGMVT
jgi:hypothetical protein